MLVKRNNRSQKDKNKEKGRRVMTHWIKKKGIVVPKCNDSQNVPINIVDGWQDGNHFKAENVQRGMNLSHMTNMASNPIKAKRSGLWIWVCSDLVDEDEEEAKSMTPARAIPTP